MSGRQRQPRTPPRRRTRDSLGFEDPRAFFSPSTPTPQKLILDFLASTPSPKTASQRKRKTATAKKLIQQFLESTPSPSPASFKGMQVSPSPQSPSKRSTERSLLTTPPRSSSRRRSSARVSESIAIGNSCTQLGRTAVTRRKNKVQCQLAWKKIA